MGINKKISTTYTISSSVDEYSNVVIGGSSASFIVGTGTNATLTVNGNLVVLGEQLIYNSTTGHISNSEIILNAGVSSNIPSNLNAAITVDRGSDLPSSITWNGITKRWTLTNDGVSYHNLATQASPGNYLTAVIDDTDPILGGNLDTNSMTITSSSNVIIAPVGNVEIDAVIQLKELSATSTPTIPTTSIPGFNQLYAEVPAGGGSGVFVTNEAGVSQELVTKRKAIVYSLIF
jgi:hypothetical protein